MTGAEGVPAPTPSQTIGPFFRFAMAHLVGAELSASDDPQPVTVHGRVLDGDGTPVPDAMIELFGLGEQRGAGTTPARFGRYLTDGDGAFSFVASKPGTRLENEAPHYEVSVFARGLMQRLMTRMYFPDEREANDRDPVLALIEPERSATLVARPDTDGLIFEIKLQGDRETVFFDW